MQIRLTWRTQIAKFQADILARADFNRQNRFGRAIKNRWESSWSGEIDRVLGERTQWSSSEKLRPSFRHPGRASNATIENHGFQ
jgi:hypothetical protein